ncbi:MAG: hypothetical protein ACI4D7_03305 [Lachnospiraceae bacterium]
MNKQRGWLVLLASSLLLMLRFPDLTLQGTRRGLLLWYQHFLPAVFPFMILSSIMTGFLHGGGPVFAALAGFLNGYPNGAKIASDLSERKLLSENMAPYYAVFCNQSSPMFLSAFAGLKKEMPWIYISSVFLLFLTGQIEKWQKRNSADKSRVSQNPETVSSGFSGDYLLDCTGIMVKAGIYIMYFSILVSFLSGISNRFPTIRFLIPFLEITTGITYIRNSDIFTGKIQQMLILFLCVSGGICTAFQTMEVTGNLNLSLKRYLLLKLIQAFFTCFICILFC